MASLIRESVTDLPSTEVYQGYSDDNKFSPWKFKDGAPVFYDTIYARLVGDKCHILFQVFGAYKSSLVGSMTVDIKIIVRIKENSPLYPGHLFQFLHSIFPPKPVNDLVLSYYGLEENILIPAEQRLRDRMSEFEPLGYRVAFPFVRFIESFPRDFDLLPIRSKLITEQDESRHVCIKNYLNPPPSSKKREATSHDEEPESKKMKSS